jgi:hypothetical protein
MTEAYKKTKEKAAKIKDMKKYKRVENNVYEYNKNNKTHRMNIRKKCCSCSMYMK